MRLARWRVGFAPLVLGALLASCGGHAAKSSPGSANAANHLAGTASAAAGGASASSGSQTSRTATSHGGVSGGRRAGQLSGGALAAGAGGTYVDPLGRVQRRARAPSTHLLSVTEVVHVTGRRGPVITQQGFVTGPQIGRGQVVMQARISAGSRVSVSFTVRGGGGSVTGLADAGLRLKGATILYRGTAHLTSGTGRFKGVRAPHLAVTGSGDLQGLTTLHVTGVEWY